MTTLFYVWCAFAVATAGIALFRKFVAHHLLPIRRMTTYT